MKKIVRSNFYIKQCYICFESWNRNTSHELGIHNRQFQMIESNYGYHDNKLQKYQAATNGDDTDWDFFFQIQTDVHIERNRVKLLLIIMYHKTDV